MVVRLTTRPLLLPGFMCPPPQDLAGAKSIVLSDTGTTLCKIAQM